uniref:Ubiquitin-ribosomal protein eL40 fusion protein n=1 Tax=Calidris pygmaea TaxID=425635 RepID=A0A8C3IY71_9CHAR
EQGQTITLEGKLSDITATMKSKSQEDDGNTFPGHRLQQVPTLYMVSHLCGGMSEPSLHQLAQKCHHNKKVLCRKGYQLGHPRAARHWQPVQSHLENHRMVWVGRTFYYLPYNEQGHLQVHQVLLSHRFGVIRNCSLAH